ncbi:hypothetical protein [Kitasatospora purpeofusca]|uniref:hypothetical protein n=1 Tax=Kitasatospora purpeofusca TaxID=67352 RepID=UPI0036D383DC
MGIVAEAAGIPNIALNLQPPTPTRAFAQAVTGTHPLGGVGNLLAGHTVQAAIDRLLTPAVHDLRRQLGLPRRSVAHARPNRTVLHGFSPLVAPRPADWHPPHQVTGYWWPATAPAWQPPHRLLAFLSAGPPPVDPERLTTTVLAAVIP